jgi:hypothetical protein
MGQGREDFRREGGLIRQAPKERPKSPPSSAPPAARNSRRATRRRRTARSARTSANTCRRAGRPGRRCRRSRHPTSTAGASTNPRDRHRHPARLRDRPARAAATHRRRQRAVGLLSLVDAATATLVGALGGITAIAISHPHFYTGMVEWSRAFGGVPIHLHGADRAWIMRPDPRHPAVGRRDLGARARRHPGSLRRAFPGGTVLHWAEGAGGRGVLCAGDIAAVDPDRKWLGFSCAARRRVGVSPRASILTKPPSNGCRTRSAQRGVHIADKSIDGNLDDRFHETNQIGPDGIEPTGLIPRSRAKHGVSKDGRRHNLACGRPSRRRSGRRCLMTSI